jgi:hypothetical protein
MAFKDTLAGLFNPPPIEVGAPDALKAWSQQSKLNFPQQAAQYAMLGQGLKNMFQPAPSFEPIANEYMRAYREKTIPGLLSQHVGSLGGGDFQRAVAQGDVDLASRLAGMKAEFQQHQSDKGREFATNLLNMSTRPTLENVYSPIPFESAKQYLQQNKGIANPSPEQVNEVLPMFQTQPSLGQSIIGGGQQAASDIRELYKQGGMPAVKNYLTQRAQAGLTGQPYTRPESAQAVADRQQFQAQYPQLGAQIQQNLATANPEQQSAANWVLSHKTAHMPILNERLPNEAWANIQSWMQSPHKAVQQIPYHVKSQQDVEEFNKMYQQALSTNNFKKLANYIRKKYGYRMEQ